MQAGDIVKLKTNFEKELNKLGFCQHHVYAVSMGFKKGLLKIAYIRHDNKLDIDFAVFSPFFEVPTKCLELVNGKDLLRNFKINKRDKLKNPIQYIELEKEKIK